MTADCAPMPESQAGMGRARTGAAPAGARESGGDHGEVFPLPQPWPEEACRQSGLGRRCRQRIDRRLARQKATSQVIETLNDLAVGGDLGARHHEFRRSRPTPAQADVLERAFASTAEAPSKGAEYHPEAAFKVLLRAGSDYGGPAGGLASYRRGAVSLPTGQTTAVALEEVLGGDALADIQQIDERMLLGNEELAAVVEERGWPRVYHDPAFKSPKQYLSFIKELYDCGVVRFTDTVTCELGLFFVTKKNGKLRLIVDARVANQYFRTPLVAATPVRHRYQIFGFRMGRIHTSGSTT